MKLDVDLDQAIRKIPDFPKPGILFYDITSVLKDPAAFAYCINEAKTWINTLKPDAIAAIDARGFLFAAPVAKDLALPLIMVRKKGKLPGKVYSEDFALEYGTDTVEVHADDVPENARVVIVDDLIATGGTLAASARLFRKGGAQLAGVFGVIGLPFLGFHTVLQDMPVKTLVDYHSETGD
ncbi:adenine phosphoribosyltransferase [Spirochaeta africana]|uniref:Adenine phosphoribosyltransferase n=1 Tax=Spirochaeta africana (strain ATCC 700263 / DSM 8902 / Z-7692) TaxID=889378 RepID=H9UKA8_SPIAZ|nr:adenine phosphoribosyltransferase [Spirochaeta africana]AFG37951.1 PRPP-binding protein, adenine/guanine phosphoribosyltransferase [Spirochaeta africana DSM 8902]